MRTLIVAVLLVSVLTVVSSAQTTPRAELFGGYSFLRADGNPLPTNFNLHGWQTSATIKATRWLGFTANFGGTYGTPDVLGIGIKTKINTHTFLFGPTFSYRNKSRWTPFSHVLFGVARGSLSDVGLSDHGFAMAAGGGVDFRLNKFMTTRIAQVDWVRTSLFSTNQNHARVTTGLVFAF
jgi:hypothetical protein